MKKLNKKGGFTLVEMLIVLAIIAILIAVSIPLINSSLEKAREATDAANVRAAKAEGAIVFLAGGTIKGNTSATEPGTSFTCWYNAADGELTTTKDECGQGTSAGTDPDRAGQGIKVTADAAAGTVSAEWAASLS